MDRPVWRDALLAFLLNRGCWLIATILVAIHQGGPVSHACDPQAYLGDLVAGAWRWDACHYLRIARHGYELDASFSNLQFYPLFPLVMAAIGALLGEGSEFALTLVANHLFFFAGLLFVGRWARPRFGPEMGRRTMMLLAATPFGFFFSAAYTEPLFLALTAGCFVALDRRRYVLGAGAAFLAALTRPTGILLIAPMALYLREARQRGQDVRMRHILVLTAAPAGVMMFMAYQWWVFGDPFLSLTEQDAYYRILTLPPIAFIASLGSILAGHAWPADPFDALSIALGTWGSIALYKRNAAAAAFCLLSVLSYAALPVAGYKLLSAGRFVMVLFPLYLVLARALGGDGYRKLLALTALLQCVFAMMWMKGHFLG